MVRKPYTPPALSHDPADKLLACLNYSATPIDKHRAYFDACMRWYNQLSPDHRETALTVIDAYSGPHRNAAAGIAAAMPAAPKCPL